MGSLANSFFRQSALFSVCKRVLCAHRRQTLAITRLHIRMYPGLGSCHRGARVWVQKSLWPPAHVPVHRSVWAHGRLFKFIKFTKVARKSRGDSFIFCPSFRNRNPPCGIDKTADLSRKESAESRKTTKTRRFVGASLKNIVLVLVPL